MAQGKQDKAPDREVWLGCDEVEEPDLMILDKLGNGLADEIVRLNLPTSYAQSAVAKLVYERRGR